LCPDLGNILNLIQQGDHMAQREGPVPQLPQVLILSPKERFGLSHLPLEPSDALRGLAEQPQDLGSHHTMMNIKCKQQLRSTNGKDE
jgi:hypothetical protein